VLKAAGPIAGKPAPTGFGGTSIILGDTKNLWELASDGGGSDGIDSSYADAFPTMISTVATVSAQTNPCRSEPARDEARPVDIL
jgi:hypothetical protein